MRYARTSGQLVIMPYRSPAGTLLLGSAGNRLCLCDWACRKNRSAIDARIRREFARGCDDGKSDVLDRTIQQLNGYFRNGRKTFSVPLAPAGTPFQRQVWTELANVPYGTTISYRELAANMENPDAVRAVAAAVGANALSLFIPCHRVVGSDGSLTGYAGGVPAKELLLKHEGAWPQP